VVKEDESVDWKERYRTTYHFRKGIFMGDRKKNEITIRLDSACLVAEEPALALTGEVRARAPPNRTRTRTRTAAHADRVYVSRR
jgi:hypothetical protein